MNFECVWVHLYLLEADMFIIDVHNIDVYNQSMIINFEMKKISGGEAKQNPRDST
jgi:hypothetical protein